MIGHKAREFKPLTAISVEDLIPKGNFYRQLEEQLNLSFIHEIVSPFYLEIGRASIDPIVFLNSS